MKFEDKLFITVMFLIVWLAIFALGKRSHTHAAESAIVSFNDAEHLVALQDSVVGVCDSAIAGPLYDSEIFDAYNIITCRELVCVTVETHIRWERCPTDQDPWKFTPGEAIINYRRVRQ